MKLNQKNLFLLFSATLITVLSSCHRGTGHSGCPTWGKIKNEQTAKKSV